MRQISFSAHEDHSSGDWVVSVSYGDNRVSVAACNGEAEADLIAQSLNTVCSDPVSGNDLVLGRWLEYMSFADER